MEREKEINFLIWETVKESVESLTYTACLSEDYKDWTDKEKEELVKRCNNFLIQTKKGLEIK
jgi:hypothetical protein